MDKILRIASVRAGHRVGAVNNLQPRNAGRALDELLVRRGESSHRRKARFGVVGRGEISVLVVKIGFQQQAGLGIDVGSAFRQ